MKLTRSIAGFFRKAPRSIQVSSGASMLIASLPLGLYVGFWRCFIGGIVDLIDQVKGPGTVSALAVAWAIFKTMFATGLGVGTAAILLAVGAMLLAWSEDKTEQARVSSDSTEDEEDGKSKSSDTNVIHVDFIKGVRIDKEGVTSAEADEAQEPLRIVLEFPPRVVTRMNTLKRLTGVESHMESVRRALSIYDALISLKAEGHEVGYYDNGQWVEIRWPLP